MRLAAPVSEAELAAEAARVRAEVDRARVRAQWERERAAAERQAALDADRVAREHARERAQELARVRAERRAARRVVCGRLLARVRLLVPLLVVNAAAVYGQLAYAFGEIAPAWWAWPARLALAVLFAAAVESIAVYVGWHAHDALLAKATVTAARLRRASYLIAAAVAGINYAHFAGPGLAPNAAAVAFGLLSLLSPWLWGLHTRRVQHVQLQDSGIIDGTGAVFSAERYRAFPVRTWAARRWSIDHNVTDPAAAWAGYNTARAAYRQAYPSGRARTAWAALRGQLATVAVPVTVATPVAEGGAGAAAAGHPGVHAARTGTGRRARTGTRARRRTGTRTDVELAAVLAEVPRDPDGTVPVRRAAAALGCGPDRARRLLAAAGLLRTDPATDRTGGSVEGAA